MRQILACLMAAFVFLMATWWTGFKPVPEPPAYVPPPTKAERWRAEETRRLREIGDDLESLSRRLKRDREESDREIRQIEAEWRKLDLEYEVERLRPPTAEERRQNLRKLDKLWEDRVGPSKEEKPEQPHRRLVPRQGDKFA